MGPACMKVIKATQQICEGACQAGCVQLQGRGPRGTGLSATDQGVDMVIAYRKIFNTFTTNKHCKFGGIS
ncbi:hypothetical protein F2Q70_00039966 [Brassica cretica]|uniref:Uncharacterized protein n=2 Tax=Brassica cretica TaxID=69181 RepID=A0A8S9K7R7_BRACR|nr:hypothetical protein F2Q70_00039966 [Brassica cretica]KAF3493215.1 hypothetical protein DY000_02054727 [Brassica cretica]